MKADGIAGLLAGLATRTFSAEELAREALHAAEAATDLNAFVTLSAEQALAAAAASDRRRAAGRALPLDGIPVAHKDLFCTAGVRTTCGSRMLEHFVPPYEATATARLAAAGMVPVGKANLDEFAMGSSGENSWFGPTRNPWDPSRVPGGSSSGSAAAVAAGIVPAATGTDTGGSIRQPAALCGVTGIKPTYGRVSRFGMIAFASSLDQGGVLARSAEDCALVLEAMAGHDPGDSTSFDRPVPTWPATLEAPIAGLRIGLPAPYWSADVDPAVAAVVHEACRVLEREGAVLVDVDLPASDLAVACYYVLAPAEASSNLARYDGARFGHRCAAPKSLEDLYERSRAEGFGPEVRRRILTGTYALSAGYYDEYYGQAQRVRRRIAEAFRAAFAEVDVLAAPTTPSVAFPLGAKVDDPIAMYRCDVNTVGVNLAGLPGLSAPCGFVDGLPVGLQLIAPAFEEGRLLSLAHRFQRATDWHLRSPRL